MPALPEAEIVRRLAQCPGWAAGAQGLTRTFVRKDFSDALAFVNRIGTIAEAADHHPEILIHRYKRVTLTLTTHSEHGVTEKDFDLARKIDGAAAPSA